MQSGVRWLANYISFCDFLAFANVIFTLLQAARTISGAKRHLTAGKLHIILLFSCICVCNFRPVLSRRTHFFVQSGLAIYISFCYFPAFAYVISTLPQAAEHIFCAKRPGNLHIILLFSCIRECNFHFALSRRTHFLCKAACGVWQFTYHFAAFLRLRM